ncbi:hypothetical protein VNO77_04280 [Canavalia gladiata]|uniref:Uncharacterized protein n=1 Tax=Canavalia gladiata TaxID=3824 RepID=A0AAN9MX30_CANGL
MVDGNVKVKGNPLYEQLASLVPSQIQDTLLLPSCLSSFREKTLAYLLEEEVAVELEEALVEEVMICQECDQPDARLGLAYATPAEGFVWELVIWVWASCGGWAL